MSMIDNVTKLYSSSIKIIEYMLAEKNKIKEVKQINNQLHLSEIHIRKLLNNLCNIGILEKNAAGNQNLYKLSDEFIKIYKEWENKEYSHTTEEKNRYEKLDEKYWIIYPLTKSLVENRTIFNIINKSCLELGEFVGVEAVTIYHYMKILHSNDFIKIIKRSNKNVYQVNDNIISIWEELEKW